MECTTAVLCWCCEACKFIDFQIKDKYIELGHSIWGFLSTFKQGAEREETGRKERRGKDRVAEKDVFVSLVASYSSWVKILRASCFSNYIPIKNK